MPTEAGRGRVDIEGGYEMQQTGVNSDPYGSVVPYGIDDPLQVWMTHSS